MAGKRGLTTSASAAILRKSRRSARHLVPRWMMVEMEATDEQANRRAPRHCHHNSALHPSADGSVTAPWAR